jgi:trehalose synthase
MVAAMLRCSGLESGPCPARPAFERLDGTRSHLDRRAALDGGGQFPTGARLLVQVSRWDRLKDHAGVARAFREHVAESTDAHLVLAGPDTAAVVDDPEGEEVLEEIRREWSGWPEELRSRIHVASLPMTDTEENGALVNALQRRANVIVQKSLAEGFGLTVAEGMWKAKPVIGSRVGGISDQITDGESGLLVEPDDLEGFGRAAARLLRSPEEAARLGARAREAVRDNFLGPRHLRQYVDLFERLLAREA